jgi:hypothetical protein
MDLGVHLRTLYCIVIISVFKNVKLHSQSIGSVLTQRRFNSTVPLFYLTESGSTKILGSGSGVNCQKLRRGNVLVQLLTVFDADPRSGIFLTLDPGSGMEKFASGMNIRY